MRDAFYTILIVWILWKVLNSISSYKTRQNSNPIPPPNNNNRKEGETSINYAPPAKKKINDDEGEYVDYEELK